MNQRKESIAVKRVVLLLREARWNISYECGPPPIIANSADSQRWGFTEKSIQGLGGVNGLFVRYLREKFQEPNIFNQDGLCLRMLLMLIDQKNNVRAGRLTTDQIKAKLNAPVSDEDFGQALGWLQKLRLLVKYEDTGKEAEYELAHERLVAPIRSLSRTELNDVEKARLLWEQRTNEWLVNNRSPRFALPWQEWRLIRRVKPQLETTEAKEDLLQATRQKFTRLGVVGAVTGLMLVTILGISQTDWWVIEHRLQPSLEADLTRQHNWSLLADSTYRPNDAYLWRNLGQVLQNTQKITDESDKAYVYRDLATAAGQLKESKQALYYLTTIATAAQKITSESDKAYVYRDLATAAGQLKESKQALYYLNLAVTAAQKITDESDKADVYRALATDLPRTDKVGLKNLRDSVNTVTDDPTRSFVSRVYTLAGEWQEAYHVSTEIGDATDRQKAQLQILKAYYASK